MNFVEMYVGGGLPSVTHTYTQAATTRTQCRDNLNEPTECGGSSLVVIWIFLI